MNGVYTHKVFFVFYFYFLYFHKSIFVFNRHITVFAIDNDSKTQPNGLYSFISILFVVFVGCSGAIYTK